MKKGPTSCSSSLLRPIKTIVALLVAFVMGCAAAVPLAPLSSDNAAKSFLVPKGKANIYVVQIGGYGASVSIAQVFLNGQPRGGLSAKTFHLVVVEPGTHTIVATSPENQEVASLQAEADKNYFVGVQSKVGVNSMRVTVLKLSEVEGTDAVNSAKLAAGLVISD